jgi:DNA mismatch endonuclease (patch repair protein)
VSDVMTPEQRKKAMRANRGRTKPERALAARLWHCGMRYLTADGYKRVYEKTVPGHPDIIFPSSRLVVFVDGCFWHGCPGCNKVPPSMSSFWLDKIRTNIKRDRRVTSTLKRRGWRVVRIWEHSVKTNPGLVTQAEKLVKYVRHT